MDKLGISFSKGVEWFRCAFSGCHGKKLGTGKLVLTTN